MVGGIIVVDDVDGGDVDDGGCSCGMMPTRSPIKAKRDQEKYGKGGERRREGRRGWRVCSVCAWP